LGGDPAKSLDATLGHRRHVNRLVGWARGQRVEPSEPQKIVNNAAQSLGLIGDSLQSASILTHRTRRAQSQTHLRFDDAERCSQLVGRISREL
jgi:hypothetical protein